MVFEKYIVQLLDKYLSEYIENVDYKKLKLDVWSGMFNSFDYCYEILLYF